MTLKRITKLGIPKTIFYSNGLEESQWKQALDIMVKKL